MVIAFVLKLNFFFPSIQQFEYVKPATGLISLVIRYSYLSDLNHVSKRYYCLSYTAGFKSWDMLLITVVVQLERSLM